MSMDRRTWTRNDACAWGERGFEEAMISRVVYVYGASKRMEEVLVRKMMDMVHRGNACKLARMDTLFASLGLGIACNTYADILAPPGQRSKDPQDLLQGKRLQEAHPAQGHPVQGRKGMAELFMKSRFSSA